MIRKLLNALFGKPEFVLTLDEFIASERAKIVVYEQLTAIKHVLQMAINDGVRPPVNIATCDDAARRDHYDAVMGLITMAVTDNTLLPEDVLEYIDDYTCERMGVLHNGLMCYGGTRDSTEMYINNLIRLIDRHLKEEM